MKVWLKTVVFALALILYIQIKLAGLQFLLFSYFAFFMYFIWSTTKAAHRYQIKSNQPILNQTGILFQHCHGPEVLLTSPRRFCANPLSFLCISCEKPWYWATEGRERACSYSPQELSAVSALKSLNISASVNVAEKLGVFLILGLSKYSLHTLAPTHAVCSC